MKRLDKNIIIRIINKIISFRYDFELVRAYHNESRPNSGVTTHMEFLKSISDKKTLTIFDVGSHKGWWTSLARHTFPQAEIHMFDVNDYKVILDRNMHFHEVCLSDRKKAVTFWQNLSTGDSYYREKLTMTSKGISESRWKPKKTTTVKMDDYCKEYLLPPPDLIKIDTQGSEIDILNGAIRTISSCKWIICEVPLIEYNDGAPKIFEYLEFFESQKFSPTKILEVHFVNNYIAQIDVVFEKNNL